MHCKQLIVVSRLVTRRQCTVLIKGSYTSLSVLNTAVPSSRALAVFWIAFTVSDSFCNPPNLHYFNSPLNSTSSRVFSWGDEGDSASRVLNPIDFIFLLYLILPFTLTYSKPVCDLFYIYSLFFIVLYSWTRRIRCCKYCECLGISCPAHSLDVFCQ